MLVTDALLAFIVAATLLTLTRGLDTALALRTATVKGGKKPCMLGNVLNLKMGVFYVSFLPQFIPQGHSPVLWIFVLVSKVLVADFNALGKK